MIIPIEVLMFILQKLLVFQCVVLDILVLINKVSYWVCTLFTVTVASKERQHRQGQKALRELVSKQQAANS